MRTLQKFSGLNNVKQATELTDADLTVASNVDLDLEGLASRRAGFGQASAVHHANVWQADGFTLATRGAAGDLVNLEADTVLVAGLGHTRTWYHNLPNGRTLYSNGVSQGTVGAADAAAWGVPIPVSVGEAADVAGQLHPGLYQWALTHRRTADGRESGPVYSNASIDVTTGGILLSSLPVLAGHSTNVYLSSHNGGERWLAGNTTTDSFMFTGANSALQQRLLTTDLQPPPVGRLVSFWRGRTLVAVGNALHASRPNAWELFDLQRDFKHFSAPITLVQPVSGGIWLGTEQELSFLAGEQWDNLVRHVREPAGVVLGSGVRIPGADLRFARGRASSDAMACICDGWVMAGTSDGTLVQLSRERYRTAATEVAATFRKVGDIPQYIAVEQ